MFSKDFKELLKLLHENQIEYLIVGGYAVGVHGYPRYTGDIDIWINFSTYNVTKLPKVLREFGFDVDEIEKIDFKNKDNIIRLGNPPFRVDFMFEIDGVNFKDCYPNKIEKEIDGISMNFIGLKDLIKNKKSCNRKKDQIDLENLE